MTKRCSSVRALAQAGSAVHIGLLSSAPSTGLAHSVLFATKLASASMVSPSARMLPISFSAPSSSPRTLLPPSRS
ncbi:Uncharacterised protein [Mycobacterium tuberculosis]|uniref:Uncharacterized protein n=1 Tax=Mycobacterium tuberculosis TaxID=1773 RepID=A0A916LG98_MYCTX|nr:Uncharacterised protein [Mycobacterium tuberculosis]